MHFAELLGGTEAPVHNQAIGSATPANKCEP